MKGSQVKNIINNPEDMNKKIKYFQTNKDSEWYIIGKNIKEGPYNDFCLYNRLYEIFYECFTKKLDIPNYILNNKKTSIFITMDDCFKNLDAKFGFLLQSILQSPMIPISAQLDQFYKLAYHNQKIEKNN